MTALEKGELLDIEVETMGNLRRIIFGFSFILISSLCVFGQTVFSDESNINKIEGDYSETGFGLSIAVGRKNTRPTIPNVAPFVTNLILNKTVFSNSFDSIAQIEVLTEAFDTENDPVVFDYEISGGKIIGSGAKVIWDLSGVKAGTYKITVWVDDGCGKCSNSMIQEIKVIE